MTMPAPEITEDAMELPLANWRALRAAAHDDKMAEEKAAAQARRDARAVVPATALASWFPPPANDNANPKPGGWRKSLVATPFVWRDPATIPRREWLFGRHYVRKFLSVTFGAGGGGKSAHSITEALSMVSGKPLLTEIPRTPLRVWSINLEDDVDEIDRRFMAAAIHFGLSPDDVVGRLFTDSGRNQQVVVARAVGRETRIVEPMVDAIIGEIRAREIDVLIVDPFVSTHEVSENDNSAIQQVASAWVRVAHEANCSVELVHHVRKSNGSEATADDGRGAGALKDKARSVRVVNAMTADEAGNAGLPAAQAPFHFRIDSGKANMAPPRSKGSVWRRFQSVKLGNGAGFLDPSDDIGVVVEWHWPTTDDVKAELPDGAFDALLGKLACGNYRESDQAIQWAGEAVAEVLRLDPKQPDDKRRIKGLLRSWLQSGDLQTVVKQDHKRVDRKYIVPAAAPPE